MCLTHAPQVPTPRLWKPGMDKFHNNKANFKDALEYMDTLIGRLVTTLEKLGLREDTVIFFAADNGSGCDGKAEPTELGARVPMVVNGPGTVKARGATMELTDLSDILPTLMELTGVPLPTDRIIDGHSYARFLRGKADHTRDWIFSFIADARILRTKRWLLEDNTPLHYGRLYDCGSCRDGTSYKEVTESTAPEMLEIKQYFATLLDKLPAPVLPEEGRPKNKKPGRRQARKQERRKALSGTER
jgi:arylsulfatase A